MPVIHHDNMLDRCTNGKGNLWNYSACELAELDAGAHFGTQFEGERIPTLMAVLECCRELSLGLNLEVKHLTVSADDQPTAHEVAMEEELANIVCDTIEQSKISTDQLVFSSFSRAAVAVLRRRLPHFDCAFLVKSIPSDWADFVEKHGCVSLNFDHTKNAREDILKCALRLPVYAYTVNDVPRALELISWGVSGVYSDHPDILEAALAAQDRALSAVPQRDRRHSNPEPPVEPALSPRMRRLSTGSFHRSKSWKELSLESVVDQALRFSQLSLPE